MSTLSDVKFAHHFWVVMHYG